MNDNTNPFTGWLNSHSLRQVREYVRACSSEAEEYPDKLKMLFLLMYTASAVTELFGSLDKDTLQADMKKQSEETFSKLKGVYDDFELELSQDMVVLEVLGVDRESGDAVKAVRSSLDNLQEIVKHYAEESENKPIAKKQLRNGK